MSEAILRGTATAPGAALGPAVVYRPASEQTGRREAGPPEEERARYQEAVKAVEQALQELMAKADDQAREILQAHLMMLQDPALQEQVEAGLAAGQTAEAAVDAAAKQFAAILEGLDDPYLKERGADVRDVGRRLLNALAGNAGGLTLTRPSVVVARDLGPSDTIGLDRPLLLGIVTEVGGPTSHTAILARSWGIPGVVVPGVLQKLADGATVVVDGTSGELIIEPDEQTAGRYREQIRAAQEQAERDRAEAGLPAETPDGHRVALAANAGQPGDVPTAVELGAEAVGLFRSEFLFMGRETAPTADEQYAAYAEALKAARGRRVIIRTLDIGGDKHVKYLGLEPEENPFLGLRALRLCFERTDLFRTQCRALLRAGVHGRLAIMFPMVGSLEDLRRAKEALAEARRSLEAEGVPHVAEPELGIMIEIPSAALIAPHLAKEVDFFSIGTNDLVQYTLAVDRGNPGLKAYYKPLHPAVLRLIEMVVQAAHDEGKWVGVCGEMGGQPASALLLLGLGVDELSMSPAALPKIRRLVRATPYSEAERVAREALAAATPDEVEALVQPFLK